jgi:predicted DsbA family dithiol-disulfide isomerase
MSVVKISYFSDALCIWAYIAQARIDAVKENSVTRFDWTIGSVLSLAIRPQSHFTLARQG